jgi:excinuclease UvrABC nuclease subunit
MIQVTIPEFKTFHYKEIKGIEPRGGVYLLYTKDDKLLYVGKAGDLKGRVYSHFSGNGGNKIAAFKQYIHYCKTSYEDDPVFQDMYETFLINELRPYINMKKVFKYSVFENRKWMRILEIRKWNGEAYNYYSCKAITTNNTQCQQEPVHGDLCKMHYEISLKKEINRAN